MVIVSVTFIIVLWSSLGFYPAFTQAGLTSFLLLAAAAFRRSPPRSKTGVEDSSTGDTTLLVAEIGRGSHVMIGSSRFTALKRIQSGSVCMANSETPSPGDR